MYTLRVAFSALCLFFAAGVYGKTRHVTDCSELQQALNESVIVKIVVTEPIHCTRRNWREAIIINRDLEITGALSEFKKQHSQLPSINWTDVSHVLIVENAILGVHNLVMYQDEMGGGGVRIAFLHTREGSTAVFTGSILIIDLCLQPVRIYQSLMEQVPRPEIFSGKQRVETIDEKVILVQDIAVWWPNLNSVWQICNSILICVDDFKGYIPIIEYFETELIVDSCIDTNTVETQSISIPTMTSNAVDDKSDKKKTSWDDALVTVGVVAGSILFVIIITGLITYKYLCRRKSFENQPSFNSRRPLSSLEEDGTSSRILNNKHDSEFFGRLPNLPMQDVVIGTLLGRGGFGKVYKGTWKGTSVAIKIIKHGERQLQNDLNLPFEAYLSRNISHPNVVQTFLIHTRPKGGQNGITVDTLDFNANSPGSRNKNTSGPSHDLFSNTAPAASVGRADGNLFETWLVLEYCDRGSLLAAIREGCFTPKGENGPLMDHVLLSALDVSNAMNYLHTLGITHGDLKADNVLLKSASTDRRGFFCKVSDFGLSRYVGKDDYLQTFTYGTLSHMPPELLKNGTFSTAVDVYSFGILLWELLASTRPYDGRSHGDILMMVINDSRRPEITDVYPKMYADLIRDCWHQDPEHRPRFSEVVDRLKRMLADLEMGRSLWRDSDGQSEPDLSAPARDQMVVKASSFLTTMPHDVPNHGSMSIPPPNCVFASEPSCCHAQIEETQNQPAEWTHSGPYTTDSAGSLPPSPQTSESGFSDFT